jgi:hypothetical protein
VIISDIVRKKLAGVAPKDPRAGRAPTDALHRRGVAREHDPGRISDAGAEVVDRERDRFEPLDEARPAAHIVPRTDRTSARSLATWARCSISGSGGAAIAA